MSDNVVDKSNEFHNNVLLQEFYRLRKELSNQQYSALNPAKIARFNELQKSIALQKSINETKEKIKQKIISSDESNNNSVVYTAMTNFKKEND